MRTADWTDSVSVLDRVTAVFDAFGEHDEGLGVSELARRASIPKSTVSRIAAELVEQRLLDRDGDKFFLGARLYELGQGVDEPQLLRRLAYPVMGGVRDVTGHSVQLAILDGTDVVFLGVVRAEPTVRPHSTVGGRLPAHTTAVGKAIMAFSPSEVVDRVIRGGLPARTPHTITQPDALLRELRQIRATGVATERDECVRGRSCAAGAILTATGDAFAAVSVAGATPDIMVDRVASAVRAAAATLTNRAIALHAN